MAFLKSKYSRLSPGVPKDEPRKKGIDDVLFLLHKLLAHFEAVALTLDVDDGAMVQDTVEDGGGVRGTACREEQALLRLSRREGNLAATRVGEAECGYGSGRAVNGGFA